MQFLRTLYFRSFPYVEIFLSWNKFKITGMDLTSDSLSLYLQNSRERRRREEEPASRPGEAHSGKEEGTLIKKSCKNCNQPFETSNPRKETCSDKCRSVFREEKKLNMKLLPEVTEKKPWWRFY